MNLIEVRIKNFRSIKNATVYFNSSLKILVGVNESGKTNILKAMRLLDKEILPSPEDVRQLPHSEQESGESAVRFVFEASSEEKIRIEEITDNKILAFDYLENTIMKNGNQLITAGDFINSNQQIIYRVILSPASKSYTYWTPNSKLKAFGDWYSVPESVSSDTIKIDYEGHSYDLKDFKIVHGSLLKDEQKALLSIATVSDWHNLLHDSYKSILIENHPKCIYWDYSEQNLLKERVLRDEFLANPEVSNPLKHIFWLSGIRDIKEKFETEKNKAAGIRNLLIRVASNATKYIHEAWPEYNGISISISESGEYIESYIQDKYNQYGMSNRSDGFKRFITFILSVSARNTSDDLNNVIFIQDEPDIGLHPSAARYLLSELLKISKTNKVIFSTHSIFMIDKNRIDNHYIVNKTDETTQISVANSSNIADEEVLYNALGHSIFDVIKPINIIFEGWKDKKFFAIAVDSPPYKLRRLKKLESIGIVHSYGVKDVPRVASFLEMANRKYYVISDADKPAKEKQSKFGGTGKWIRYDQILGLDQEFTLEDFYSIDYFKKSSEKYIDENSIFADKDKPKYSETSPVVSTLETWLIQNGLSKPDAKELLNHIKEDLISNLSEENIRPVYFDLLDKVQKFIDDDIKT